MDDDRQEIAERIRGELEQRGWSQRTLADKAMLGEATVFRLLKGDYSRKSLLKVVQVLGISLEEPAPAASAPVHVADLRYGGYARDLYDYYAGDYLCVRAAFSDPSKVMIYEMEISWCDETRGLIFVDRNPGYEQRGTIHVPTGTQFLHFITLDSGSARMITAYHMPPSAHFMRAMVMTFANPKGRELIPAAAPLVMCRRDSDPALDEVSAGLFDRSASAIASVVTLFEKVECDSLFLGEEEDR